MNTYNKIHFRISIISITLFIFLYLPEVKLNAQELSFVENIKLRSTENLGTNPGASVGDIITADGKIFLYSPEGLLIYDLSTNPASFSTVDFPGNYGKFNPVYSSLRGGGDANMMTYNAGDKLLYVVTPDIRIMRVSTLNPTGNHQIILGTPNEIDHFKTLQGYNIIKYDAVHDRLYWLVEGRNNDDKIGRFHYRDTYLGVYTVSLNGQSLNRIDYILANGLINYMESIFDVEFSKTNDYFYIAQKKHLEIWQVGTNPPSISKISTKNTLAGKCGKLLYINDGPLNKIVALPFRLPFEGDANQYEPPMETNISFYIIDVNNPSVFDSVPAPSKRIMDGVFSITNDDLILCYSPDYFIQDYYPVNPESDVAFYHFYGDNFNYSGCLVNNDYPQYNGSTQMMNRPRKMFINQDNSTIIGKTHEVWKLIKNVSGYTSTKIISGESNHFGKAVEIGSKDYILDPTLNGLAVYNETNSNISYIRTAYPAYNICANPLNGNLYFSNRLASENSGFYIYNPSGTMSNINEDGKPLNDFTKPIGDLIYNPFNGHFLVSENAPNEINNQVHVKKYDGDNNLISPSIDISGQYAKEMFISPDGWLYVMYNMHQGTNIEPKIYICKAKDYSSPTVIDLSFVPDHSDPFLYYVANFLYNPRDRGVYITISPNDTIMDPYNPVTNTMCEYLTPSPLHSPNGSLIKFIGNQMVGDPYDLSYPGEIIYPDAEAPDMTSDYQGLMFIKTNALVIYNYLSSSIQQTIQHKFNDITYSAYYDKIYGISDEVVNEEPENDCNQEINIYQINPDGSIELKFEYPGQAAAFFSNPYDTMLYLFVKIDNIKLGDTPSCLLQLNPTNPDPEDEKFFEQDTVQLLNTDFYVDLDHYNDYGFHFYNIITPYIDRYSNQIYLPNGGHSNVSVINFKAEEPLFLNNEVNWLSFPRLIRQPNHTEPADDVLDRIKVPPFYYTGKMKNLVPNSSDTVYIEYLNNIWDPSNGFLNNVHSSLGYKLGNLQPKDYRCLILEGDVWPPTNNVTIYRPYENWVGYWLPEPQSPFDAIPQNILDELISIKAQNWTCGKYWRELGDGGGQGLPSYWICACHQGRVALNYGDMVILKTISRIGTSLSFPWQRFGNPPVKEIKRETDYFSFKEQEDYTPYFIELDTTELPLELAAFVEDSCVGATTVLPGDTLVLVPGYTEGLSGDITFEQYFGPLKSQQIRNVDYFVYNDRSGRKERRTLHSSEKLGFYLISFRDGDGEISFNTRNAWIRCMPNPMKDICELQFYTPKNESVDISLYDIFGRKLKTIHEGYSNEGTTLIRTALKDSCGNHLAGGIYYLVLRAGGYKAETKVVLIH
jgi:hypothetical protein